MSGTKVTQLITPQHSDLFQVKHTAVSGVMGACLKTPKTTQSCLAPTNYAWGGSLATLGKSWVHTFGRRSIRPLDRETIFNSVKKTHRLVTVELGWAQSGVGSEILSQVSEDVFDYLDAPPVRITGADVPMPYAENLENAAQPQAHHIIDVVQRVVARPFKK